MTKLSSFIRKPPALCRTETYSLTGEEEGTTIPGTLGSPGTVRKLNLPNTEN